MLNEPHELKGGTGWISTQSPRRIPAGSPTQQGQVQIQPNSNGSSTVHIPALRPTASGEPYSPYLDAGHPYSEYLDTGHLYPRYPDLARPHWPDTNWQDNPNAAPAAEAAPDPENGPQHLSRQAIAQAIEEHPGFDQDLIWQNLDDGPLEAGPPHALPQAGPLQAGPCPIALIQGRAVARRPQPCPTIAGGTAPTSVFRSSTTITVRVPYAGRTSRQV